MTNFYKKDHNLSSNVKNQVAIAFAILVIIALFNVLSFSAVVFSDGDTSGVEDTNSVDNVNTQNNEEYAGPEKINSINDLIEDNHKLSRRDNLNEKGKNLYDQLYEATKNRTDFVYVDDDEYSDERCDALSDIFVKLLGYFVLMDHPELFWTNGGISVTSLPSGAGTEYRVTVLSDCDENNIDTYKTEIEAKAQEIIKSVPMGSDYEKALWVHDYIVENTTYNNDVSWFVGKEKNFSASIYSLLLKNESNCNGYSKTYKYLMDMLDIPCTVVAGVCNDGVLHAWNIIELDGEYYQVDTTWDDPVGGKQAVHHNYFCITDEEMYKSRTIDSATSAPVCTATKMNYHVYNNLYAEEINDTVFSNAIDLYLKNNEDQIEIKFSSSDLVSHAEKYINSSNKFQKLLVQKGINSNTQVSYSNYDDTNVMEIIIE